MTREREESIKVLRHCGAEIYCQHYIKTRHCYGCNRREALDMAIEALQKEVKRQEMIIRASERYLGVVRCKDCRHRDLFSCPLADNDFQKDEDFCSWGERKKK